MTQSPYRKKKFAAPDAYGYRSGLFAPSFTLDTTVLNNLPLELEQEISKRLFKRGQQARDEARRNAPKRTGALASSIYVTAPATKKTLQNARAGKSITGQHEMLRHSQGYFRAMTAASKRMAGNRSPVGSGSLFDTVMHHRTQQWNNPNKRRGLDDLLEEIGYDDDPVEALRTMSEESPFTGMGSVGRNSFFIGFGASAYYAAWVEFGTSRQKPQSFFSGPANSFVNDTQRIIADAIRELGHGK